MSTALPPRVRWLGARWDYRPGDLQTRGWTLSDSAQSVGGPQIAYWEGAGPTPDNRLFPSGRGPSVLERGTLPESEGESGVWGESGTPVSWTGPRVLLLSQTHPLPPVDPVPETIWAHRSRPPRIPLHQWPSGFKVGGTTDPPTSTHVRNSPRRLRSGTGYGESTTGDPPGPPRVSVSVGPVSRRGP